MADDNDTQLIDGKDVDGEETNEYIPTSTNLAYGVGTLPQTANNVIGFFLNKFLLETVVIPPSYVGTALLVAKLWDAVTTPTVGLLSDRTNSPLGRRRPWMLSFGLLVGIAFVALWLVPVDATAEQKFGYIFVIHCLQQSITTAYYIPYAALTMEVARSIKARNVLTQYRFFSGGIGAIVYVLFMGILTMRSNDSLRSYQLTAILIAVIMTAGAMVCVTLVHETYRPAIETAKPQFVFWKSGLEAIKNKDFVCIVAATACVWLTLQLIQVNLQLYVSYSLLLPDQFTYGILVALILGSFFVPVARYINGTFGKKVTWAVGIFWVWAFSLTAYFSPANSVAAVYIISIEFGFAVAALLFVPWTMLPDAVDLEEIKTGVRQEGIYFSFFGLFEQIATAIGIAVSNYVLAASGYDFGNPDNQTEVVAPTIRNIISWAPLCLGTLSLVLVYFYPINHTVEVSIQARLREARRNRKSEGTGGSSLILVSASTQSA